MRLVTILRDLWRFRGTVATLVVFSLMLTTVLMYRVTFPFSLESRHSEVGIASARALIDSPSSQVVDLGGQTGADIGTLSARAGLLASLMTSSPIKDEVARRAGVPIELLVTPGSEAPGTAADSPNNVTSAAVSVDDPRAFVLRSSVPTLQSGEVPIIAVETQAPDTAGAAKLADQAIAVLRAHLENVAGNEAVPPKRRVTVRELGPARSTTAVRGPSPLLALFAGLASFAVGCGALAGGAQLVRSWRLALQGDEASSPGAATLRSATEEPAEPSGKPSERPLAAAPRRRVADEA
jgi:hypothetical protein